MNKLQFSGYCLLLLMILSSCAGLFSGGGSKGRLLDEEPIDVSDAHEDPVIGDVLDAEVVVKKSQLGKTNVAQAVQSYQRLLQQNASKTVRAEAIRRLADLTMRLTEQKELAIVDGKKETELSPELRQASYERALALYQQLIKENPDYHDKANVQYQMAKAHQLSGKQGATLDTLEFIAQKFPASSQIAETHFRRGEIYFSGRQYQQALDAYQKIVTNHPKSSFFLQALYKQGWSKYKLSDFDLAVNDFFRLLELLQKSVKSGNQTPTVRDLLADTYRVISLSFYQLEGPNSVEEYFARVGAKDYELEVYRGLTDLYLKQERFKDAADTNSIFIATHPFHPQSPALQTEIIKIYRDGGFPSLILPAKEAFVKNYGRSSEYWRRADSKVQAQLKPYLMEHLTDVTSHYHALAQKSKTPKDYMVAAEFYREYLATFPKSPNYGKNNYLLAEALYDGRFYQQALVEFEKIAYTMPKHPRRAQAAYTSLVVYQEIIKTKNPQQKTEWDKKFVVASLKFVKAYRQEKNAATVLANTIELQIRLKDLVGALASSRDLLANQVTATAKMRRRAQIVIANAEYDLGNYRFAESEINRVLAFKNLTKKERDEFNKRKADAIYKQGELAKSKGKSAEAIGHFLRVANTAGGAGTRKAAQFDAATLLLEAKKWPQAVPILLQFRKNYPGDPLQKLLPEKLLVAYEAMGRWSDAAGELKRIADAEKKGSKVQRAAYWRTAELYEKAKQPGKAIAAYRFYARNIPVPLEQNTEAKYKLVTLYQQARQADKSDFWRRDIIKSYRRAGKSAPDRLRFLAAESELHFAKPLMANYKRIKLTQPIKRSLQAKQKALTAALGAYTNVLDYGVLQFRTAAGYQIGEIYGDLAKSIMNSQRPKGMDEETLEEYEIVLEEKALPFEDKAIAAHESNVHHTKQEVYDDWVKKSFDELKEILPARYDKQEISEAYVQEIY